jgi:hypothetical protein
MTAAKLDNEDPRVEGCMSFLSSLGIVAFAAALSITAAHAFDDSNYPAFSGIWRKPPGIGNQWDQTKPLGRAQEPPFTPEYQAIFEASLARSRSDIAAIRMRSDWSTTAPRTIITF